MEITIEIAAERRRPFEPPPQARLNASIFGNSARETDTNVTS